MTSLKDWLRGLRVPLPLWRQGERAAARLLSREKGYRIVAGNWRSPDDRRDEIDLVCLDGEILVFVEVKTRFCGARVRGYLAAMRGRKRRALRRAAFAYLRALGAAGRPRAVRFDVVEVETVWGRLAEVRHFPNAPVFRRGSRVV